MENLAMIKHVILLLDVSYLWDSLGRKIYQSSVQCMPIYRTTSLQSSSTEDNSLSAINIKRDIISLCCNLDHGLRVNEERILDRKINLAQLRPPLIPRFPSPAGPQFHPIHQATSQRLWKTTNKRNIFKRYSTLYNQKQWPSPSPFLAAPEDGSTPSSRPLLPSLLARTTPPTSPSSPAVYTRLKAHHAVSSSIN